MSDLVQWLLIKSAPFGKRFLAASIFSGKIRQMSYLQRDKTGYVDEDGELIIWQDYGFQYCTQKPEPTHWLDLNLPPLPIEVVDQ